MAYNTMDFASQLTGKVKTRAMISCNQCGREFQKNRKADLVRHMRIHTDEKPYVCPYPDCRRAFRQSSALKNHSNFHQRDAAYTCTQCSFTFFDKPTFNRHVREKHDLEFIFACSVPGCGKTFKRRPVFKAHMQDKHSVQYSDNDLLAHRVPAAPYLKSTNGSKAVYHSSESPLPRLSEVIRSPDVHSVSSTYYPSNPAVYGSNNATPVLLSDPYAHMQKAAPSSYAQAPSEYSTTFSTVVPSDLWLRTGGFNYYDEQIISPEQLSACGPPTISFPTTSSPASGSPNHSFMYSSPTSSGNSNGGTGASYGPHSRSSTVSPISRQNSPSTNSLHPQYTRQYGVPVYH